MPFDRLSSLPTLSPSGQPTGSSLNVPPAGESAPATRHPIPVLRLTDLPSEILLQIARCLKRSEALLFSETARGILAALKVDIVDPVRLGGSIRWVTGLSRFQCALAAIMGAPGPCQRRLLKRLAERVSALPEHLRNAACDLLQPHRSLLAPSRARTQRHRPDGEWRRLRQSGAADDPDALLDRVLSLAPDAHLPVLAAWSASCSVASPAISAWNRILDATPPPARGQALLTMTADFPSWDQCEHAVQTIIAAVRQGLDTVGAVAEDYAAALAQEASRLPGYERWLSEKPLVQYWDEIFDLACRFPLPVQVQILSALTRTLDRDGPPKEGASPQAVPRWRRFIDDVLGRFAPGDATSILCGLASSSAAWRKHEGGEGAMPVVHALWATARTLPEACCAKLLSGIIASQAQDEDLSLALWDSAFHASEPCAPGAAAPLYLRLATAIRKLPEAARERCWDALCQRLAGVDDLLPVTHAVNELAQQPFATNSPGRRARLWRVARRLPADVRAAICKDMIVSYGITPALWQAQVLEMADLPPVARYGPAASLAYLLFRYDGDVDVFTGAVPPSPDPAAPAVAQVPCNLGQSLARLSDILAMLPLKDRAGQLLSLSQMESSPPSYNEGRATRVVWLLEETVKLAPLHHHGIEVVTKLAMSAQRDCATEADLRRIFPPLLRAVAALPADARISALSSVAALLERLLPGDTRWMQAVVALTAGLPPADTLPAPSRKRKEPPR